MSIVGIGALTEIQRAAHHRESNNRAKVTAELKARGYPIQLSLTMMWRGDAFATQYRFGVEYGENLILIAPSGATVEEVAALYHDLMFTRAVFL